MNFSQGIARHFSGVVDKFITIYVKSLQDYIHQHFKSNNVISFSTEGSRFMPFTYLTLPPQTDGRCTQRRWWWVAWTKSTVRFPCFYI